jgi:MOSC domain-containing protein YiiM
MPNGRVTDVFIAGENGGPVETAERVEVVAGRGVRGDRHFDGDGSDLTLIEAETLAALARDADIDLEPGAHRRNVVTRDVPLNHLIGERFSVGEVVCEGVGLCEPCSHLQSVVGKDGLVSALLHRGGLDARVVESGSLAVDDVVRW